MTDSNIDDKPFTVQVGKRYVRRDGEIVEIERVFQGSWSPDHKYWTDSDSYTSTGSYFGDGEESGYDLISEYKEPTAEPQDEWGPWIGWNGGECPVEEGTIIQSVGLRDDGELVEKVSASVAGGNPHSSWTWTHPDYVKLIAYRIKKEPEVLRDSVWIDEEIGAAYSLDMGDGDRQAIITLTDGEPSIRWAE